MLSLTRLFLHNWHRYSAAALDVDSGLCLTGPDDADAAAALDGLQLALLGDPAKVRFHSSRYGFTYDLDSYARGRLTEDKWQRTGNTVSYAVVEFTNTLTNAKTTHGLCIETGPRLAPEILWFSLADQLSPNTLVTKGRPLPRIELKPLLRNWRGARYFEKALDYQTDLLSVLGGLDESFFDLLQRAIHYQPLRRVEDFAAYWFLDENLVDLTRLRRMRDRLGGLRAEHDRAEKQLAALQPILKGQAEMRRLTELRDGQTLLLALLRSHAAQRRVASLESQISNLQSLISNLQSQLDSQRAAIAATETQLREAERREFEHGLAHRKTTLEWQYRYATQSADHIRQRWARLARQLRAECDGLKPLLENSSLSSEEQVALKELLVVVDAATAPERVAQGEPPPPALAAALNTVVPILLAARDRLHADRTRLADQLAEAERVARATAERIDRLTTGQLDHPAIPDHIARMQDLLTPVIGKKPPLVFEFIEVTDPRWQNAVEAVLGPARFHAIVSATWFDAAHAAIDRARAARNLGDADVHDPTQLYNRPAQPGSLAEKVTTIYPDLRAYLDAALGDIMCVETHAELAQHPRAITPDCVYQSLGQAAAFAFESYQPVVIGKTAPRVFDETRQSLAANLQSLISNLQSQITNNQSQVTYHDTHLARLAHAHSLASLRSILDSPLDERPARTEAASYEAELRALDATPLAELKSQAESLRAALAAQSKTRDELAYQLASLENQFSNLQSLVSEARLAADENKAAAASARNQFPGLLAAADEALPPHLESDDLSGEIKLVDQREKDYDKKMRDERLRLIEALAAFNAVYQLAPWPGDPNDARYAEAAARLVEAELPRLARDIAAAEGEIEDELRDHIARPLRERLAGALRALDQINDSLASLGSPHRLLTEPAPDLKDFYELITASTDKTLSHTPTLPHFYDSLTAQPDSAARLTDYRRYLSYSIEVQSADGNASRIATADGDAQLAFYSIIAAAFARLYRIRGDQLGRPCIRLVPLGAAFARMDAALLAPALDLFTRLGLQLAAAVPLERSDTLIASLPTTIVLTPVKETILPEPYRNYNALPTATEKPQAR